MLTKQHPVGSGFGPATTAKETLHGVDLTGTIAIVTGGYAGIGLETTRALADAGATVIVPVRGPEKAYNALSEIPRVEQARIDLLDPESIDLFAMQFLSSDRPVHILVNNAGILAPLLTRDSRGYESQFATNHLGHFQLTVRLWPALRAACKARVVVVSSYGHQLGQVDFDDPNFENRQYDRSAAYGQSKTANILFAVELDRRGEKYGVRAFAVHPGGIATDLFRFMSEGSLAAMGIADVKPNGAIPAGRSVDEGGTLKTPEQGAATSVWSATSPKLANLGGVYCEDVEVAELRDQESPEQRGVAPWAIDSNNAKRLWALSERLCAVELAD